MKIRLSVCALHEDRRLLYAAWFLIPLAVRSIPELRTSYPIGYDTPIYMNIAKAYSQLFGSWGNPFYQILGLVYRSGVDMIVFMKVFPTVLYAILIFVFLIYVHKRLRWELHNTLTACLLLSASPVMLRMSFDLHGQSVALIIFFASLFFIDRDKSAKNMAIITVLSMLIGVLHELIFGVLEVILLYNAVLSAVKRDKRGFRYFALLALAPIAAYLLLKLPFEPYALFYPIPPAATNIRALLTDRYFWLRLQYGDAWMWANIDWWLSVLILAYGLILPLSALGAFNHRHLTPWTALTLTAYVTAIITPFFSFNLPDRWLFLAAPPVTLYAAHAIAKLRKNLKVFIVIAIVSVQAVSMLGLLPRPLSVYAGQHYLCFTDTLLVSTTDQQTVDALREVVAWLNTNTPNDAVIGAPHDLYRWALYYVEGRKVVRCDTPPREYPYYLLWHTDEPIPQPWRPVYHYYPLTLYQLV